MQELKVYLKDCYGIGEFDETFDFSQGASTKDRHWGTSLIYAQNGLMKTSFAKSFNDIASGGSPKELVHKKVSTYTITADGNPVPPDSIFVVESKPQYFESEKMATLLADKKTQADYIAIASKIDAASGAVFKFLATKLHVRSSSDAIKKFDDQFKTSDETRLVRLLSLKEQVQKADPKYLTIDYKLFEDQRVIDFLGKPETHVALRDYFETYEKLLEQSKYFKKDVFDYINGFNSYDTLEKNNFLEVENKIILRDGTVVTEIQDLKRLFEEDKDRVFTDPELEKRYKKLDDSMQKNAQLKQLRTFMDKHRDMIPLLQNVNMMRTNILTSYLRESEVLYDQLTTEYEASAEALKAIYKKSESLETEWQKVVDKFNRNFNAPFEVAIANKRDAILNETKPVLEFKFNDGVGVAKVMDASYMSDNVLSTGESRALYILCVMFEIESRKKTPGQHLIVIDDIADSFDYKNKYAIIEYLHSVSRDNQNGINMIIMTHNFDFFRTLQMRLWGKYYREKTRVAQRTARGVITLEPLTSIFEFDRFRRDLNRDEAVFIGSIAFARNLIEYSVGTSNSDYTTLTEALHMKANTKLLTAEDILNSFNSYLSGVNTTAYGQELYVDILERNVQQVILAPGSANLEHKIVIAIDIRLKAEEFMINELVANDASYTVSATSNQTAMLFEDFVDVFTDQDKSYEVLNRVMLMTPESIHLNSFMYEPLLDMSLQELLDLNSDVRVL